MPQSQSAACVLALPPESHVWVDAGGDEEDAAFVDDHGPEVDQKEDADYSRPEELLGHANAALVGVKCRVGRNLSKLVPLCQFDLLTGWGEGEKMGNMQGHH